MTSIHQQSRFLELHGEKLRFLVVGVYNTAASFALFALAIHWWSEPLASILGGQEKVAALVIQWLVWVVAVVHSTLTMKYLVFRSRGSFAHEIGKAYLVYLPAQGISSAILWLVMAAFAWLAPGVSSRLAAMAGQGVAVIVSTVFSYIGHKHFTFRGGTGTE